MALTHLSELYLTPRPLQNRANQLSIEEFLDKKSYRWKQLRRVMRIVADKCQLTGLKDPTCDNAVKMVLDNVPDMKHMISDIESQRKLALLMVKNRAERVRKSILRKGGLRIYKRKINQKERERWDAMRNDRRKTLNVSKENTTREANLPTSSLVSETSHILYGDHHYDYEVQQDSPVHHTPWTTPEAVPSHSPSPSSILSGASTPRRRMVSRTPSPRGSIECITPPTQCNAANRKDAGIERNASTPVPSARISSPADMASEGDVSPTPKKGWKGWAVARNEEDLIPHKKFQPKSGQRTRKRRRVLDL